MLNTFWAAVVPAIDALAVLDADVDAAVERAVQGGDEAVSAGQQWIGGPCRPAVRWPSGPA